MQLEKIKYNLEIKEFLQIIKLKLNKKQFNLFYKKFINHILENRFCKGTQYFKFNNLDFKYKYIGDRNNITNKSRLLILNSFYCNL